MKKENKGFTLIELIIVIAIMGVLLGLIATNIAPMFVQSVRSSADDLQHKLADARTASYAKDGSNTFLRIEADNGRLYGTVYVNGVAQDRDRLGRFPQDVVYGLDTPSTTLADGNSLFVSFDKGSGELNCFAAETVSDSASDSDIVTSYTNAKSSSSGDLQSGVHDGIMSMQKGNIRFDVTADGLTGTSRIKRVR